MRLLVIEDERGPALAKDESPTQRLGPTATAEPKPAGPDQPAADTAAPPAPDAPAAADQPSSTDTLARLREAKQRRRGS